MDDVTIRRAGRDDLPAIVALLADDRLGAQREHPEDMAPYERAFDRLEEDPAQHLVVMERGGRIVGCLQLTIIPGLSHQGMTRAQIEGVRVSSDERGGGLGSILLRWAIDESRRLGARSLQLTSNSSRTDARRFYERLGFVPSHVGFKLDL